MVSLNARLMLVASAVLFAFFTLTGLTLERAFRESVETALREQLQTQVYLLLGAAELDPAGTLLMSEALAEPRLAMPGSGLVGAIWSDGEMLWQSASSLGDAPALVAPGGPSDPGLKDIGSDDGAAWLVLSFPVIWELDGAADRPLVFQIAASRAANSRQIRAFRSNLALGLGGAGLALLIAQALALRWGLRPLRRLVAELREIEAGNRQALSPEFPLELQPLTRSLNALIAGNSARLKRYRQALDDLAHSLKTPLAVLRTLDLPTLPEDQRLLLRDQTSRIDQTVAYHTARGASAGSNALAGPVRVHPVIAPLLQALAKVYQEKNVQVSSHVAPDCVFYGDPGDLTELLGNLLDNAFKWCSSHVRLEADGHANGRLRFVIEDDGPGIPTPGQKLAKARGGRLDANKPGQGIGLALARDMVEETYGGSLSIETGDLGGARIVMLLG